MEFSAPWIIGGIVGSQFFLFFARQPIHRALTALGMICSGGFRLSARWARSVADQLWEHNRQTVLNAGRHDSAKKLEREFIRLEKTFGKEMSSYPTYHRKLSEAITQIEKDFAECGDTPPEAPGWTTAVKELSKLAKGSDRMVETVLQEIHKSAVSAEKRAIQEYQQATGKRHKLLAGLQPHWKAARSALESTGKVVEETLSATRHIDEVMTKYEQVSQQKPPAVTALIGSRVQLFLISLIVMAIALGGAFINFNLIALPMSELVPAGTRIGTMPVSTVAALVIVLLEIVTGIFVMETLGITSFFPRLENLPRSRRRLLLTGSLIFLFVLALIESSLAILREQLVEQEGALKQALAGVDAVIAAPAQSSIPVIGQAILGFILPWVLAMVAIPLEMLMSSGGTVIAALVTFVLRLFGYLTRVIAHLIRFVVLILKHLYDIYIIIPLQVGRLMRSKQARSTSDG